MLRRWCSRLQATVGGAEACVRLLRWDARGQQNVIKTQNVQCAERPAEIIEVINALDQALREVTEDGHDIAGLRCDVAVADAWLVYEVLEADLDDTPRSAADELAGAALADTAGLRRNEIVLRWQRQGGTRSLACALPLGAVQALQDVLQRHKVRLGKINGEMVSAYNSWRHDIDPTCSVFAVPRKTGTQLALIANAGFTALHFEPGVGDPTSLLERSRALMRSVGFEPDDRTRYYADDNLPEDAETPWIRRVPSPHWRLRLDPFPQLPRLDLDLSPTRASVRPMSWMLLVGGVLAAIVAAVQFQTASGAHRRESRTLLALEASLNEARATGAAKSSPQEARGARASTTVIRELQVPWAKLFAALESVTSQNVALLSVEPSAQRQEIRLVAEAKSSDAMLDFLEALRAQDLREVVLVSHQVQAQAPGTPLRFQARAFWESQ